MSSNFKKLYEEVLSEKNKKYSPPYTIEEIQEHYGKDSPLLSDPVHLWRAKNGIELVNKEPELKELNRIMKNWKLMTDEMKQKSDQKSMEMFGMTNEQHYRELLPQYDSNIIEEDWKSLAAAGAIGMAGMNASAERLSIQQRLANAQISIPRKPSEYELSIQQRLKSAPVISPNKQQIVNSPLLPKFNDAKSKLLIPSTTTTTATVVPPTEKNDIKKSVESVKAGRKITDAMEISIIARTLYDEARGEGKEGIEWVGSVIHNRAEKSKQPAAYECLRRLQFSGWNGGKICTSYQEEMKQRQTKENERAKKYKRIPKKVDHDPRLLEAWNTCEEVAKKIQKGTLVPETSSYYFANLDNCNPTWAQDAGKTTKLSGGKHTFFPELAWSAPRRR